MVPNDGPVPGRRVGRRTTAGVRRGHARFRGQPPRLLRILARRFLAPALGAEGAARVVLLADRHYESPPPLARTPAGRTDVPLASHLLALRDALVEDGTSPEEATRLLAEMMTTIMGRVLRPLDVLAASVHPKDAGARTRFREDLARRVFYRAPDWVMTDVESPGCYAFDVRRCLYADYFGDRGEAEFCQRVFCDQDLRMAERRGELLLRAGTIAAGSDRCDFRYVVDADGPAGMRASP